VPVEKAWPSYQTSADATGKSVKTIQRSIRKLEVNKWLDVRRGNGTVHNTEYRPSALSILLVSGALEKTNKSPPFARPKAARSVHEGSQICPMKPER
jgi:DNA-binding transcriptional regulator YhcF (GntR family)